MTESAQSLDRLEAELKALQQQALVTQASLRQIQTHESVGPYANVVADLPKVVGMEGAALGIAAVILGAMAWWYGLRRSSQAVLRSGPAYVDSDYVPAGFSDRRSGGSDRQASSAAAGPRPDASAPLASLPQPVLEPVSAPILAPISEPPSVSNSRPSPFAAHDPSLEFDPEAAAGEVERVRKSLADKRAARAAQRAQVSSASIVRSNGRVVVDLLLDDGPSAEAQAQASTEHEFSPDVMLSDDVFSDDAVPEADTPDDSVADYALAPDQGAGDFDASILDDAALAFEPLPDFQHTPVQDAPDSNALPPVPLQPQPELVPSILLQPLLQPEPLPLESSALLRPLAQPELVPPLLPQPLLQPEPPQPAPADLEPDHVVQFALAQEFEALGLLTEARELATEVLAAADPSCREQAQALLAQIDQQEMANLRDMPLLPDFDSDRS